MELKLQYISNKYHFLTAWEDNGQFLAKSPILLQLKQRRGGSLGWSYCGLKHLPRPNERLE